MDYGDMLPLGRIQWDAEKGYYANRLRRLQYLKDVTPIVSLSPAVFTRHHY